MIFIDASALVAILAEEPEADSLLERLDRASTRLTSALAVFEATLAIGRIGVIAPDAAAGLVFDLLTRAEITLTTIDDRDAREAIQAFTRFGKGRHPAQLNMGDCFAYGCARSRGASLLFKGDDFALTDIEAA